MTTQANAPKAPRKVTKADLNSMPYGRLADLHEQMGLGGSAYLVRTDGTADQLRRNIWDAQKRAAAKLKAQRRQQAN